MTKSRSERRQRVWRHNSYIGHAAMMEKQCEAIIRADSTTEGTKALARRIQSLARELRQALSNREDHP